jgi:hypothetical protein
MKITVLTLILLILAPISLCADTETTPRRPDKAKVEEVALMASVVSINHETREVTLQGSQGEMVTLTVSDAVDRLGEVAVGDRVSVVYRTAIQAEFRDPTPEELETPLVVLAEAERTSLLEDPGAFVGTAVRAVVTIKHIVLDSQLVTIKGPRGNYLTIPVEDKNLVRDLEVGEKVIITYVEAMAVDLMKLPDNR